MLPLYKNVNSGNALLRVPFAKFSLYVVALPLLSFLFCVMWCLMFFYERSTSTHCQVDNYLPSISAAIGTYQPQRFVWQLSICGHFIPRLIIAYMYLDFHYEVIRKNRFYLAKIAFILNFIENLSLLALTVWTSSEHYEVHKFSFSLFIVTSEVYMLLVYMMNKNGRRLPLATKEEMRSIIFKRNLFFINVVSIGLATICFVRHNAYCEPGVYTLFALFEYVVVLTNMGYHMTCYWDFYGRSLAFDWKNGIYFSHL